MGVWAAVRSILGESRGEAFITRAWGHFRVRGKGCVNAVIVQDGEEDADVFETGVHALAVEGNHSVGCVA